MKFDQESSKLKRQCALRPTTNAPPPSPAIQKAMHLFITVFNIYFGNVSSFLYIFFSQHTFLFLFHCLLAVLSVTGCAAVLYLNYLFEVLQVLVHLVSQFFLSCRAVVNILLFRT